MIVKRCWMAVMATLLLAFGGGSVHAQEDAFRALFDGRTLQGWNGDARFWRVENGAIVGQTTAENTAEHNTFLIFSGEEFADFELRFSFKVQGYNSGVQYRSVAKENYVIHGYQADFEDRWHDGGKVDQYSGMFFEEGGRMFLARRGEVVVVHSATEPGGKSLIEKIGSVGDSALIEQNIRRDDWNEYVVMAREFQFTHLINGRVTAIGFDEDRQHRRRSGVLAFQLHSGPPMKIELKDIRIRVFDRDPADDSVRQGQ